MKIGIIGRGTVGGAVYEGLEYLGHTMTFYDPAWPGSTMADVVNTDVVFVCVPTDMLPSGDCDVSIVETVIHQLNSMHYRGLIAIKSTVIPGTTQRLSSQYPVLRLCNVPEFLRAKTALADFIHNHDVLVIGSHREDDQDLIRRAHGPYPHSVVCVTPTEAEIVKYFNNVHHAMQVTFANITYEVCQRLDANYMNVFTAVTKRECINPAYLMANKNTRAYGGHCLPKDTAAWNNLLSRLDIPVDLIQSVINDNERFK